MTDDASGPLVALTGGGGFLGRRVVEALVARGARVRGLVRSAPSPPLNAELVLGDLENIGALARLVQGASAIVHVAGVVKALHAGDFDRVNRVGAASLTEAARVTAPDARLVLISSLAAREPQLSRYAASKRAGEIETAARVEASRLTVVRPPAIYGPGDREFLPMFRAVRRRAPFPVFGSPVARVAMIHVADAASAIAELTLGPARPGVWTLSDGRPGGYGWREIARAAADAVGVPEPRTFAAPAAILKLVANSTALAATLRGRAVMLTPGKARELLHADWSVHPQERAPGLPTPHYTLEHGFQDTAAWYRSHGLLGPN